MKKGNLKKTLALLCFSMLAALWSFSTVNAQSFEPVEGTNYYYLTRGFWQLSNVDLQDTISISVTENESIQYAFAVGLPLGTSNYVTIIQRDTVALPVQFTMSTAQDQVTIAPGTSQAQTFRIEYIDDDIFIYKAYYNVNGTIYDYRFKMVNIN